MSKPKYNVGDQVIYYPYDNPTVIYTIKHIYLYNGIQYGLRTNLSDSYHVANEKDITLPTPEMKTKILLGIPLDD